MSETPGQMPLFDMPGADRTDHRRQLTQILEEIQTTNRDLVYQLARHKRRPDPNTVLLTRLNLVIDMLYAADPDAKLEFEIEFEREMNHKLAGWVEQSAQQTLLDLGTPLPTNGKPLIGGNGFIAP